MTPIGVVATIILTIALLTCSRRWAPVVLVAACILMTPSQSIVLGGVRFPVLRILVLAGFLRVFARKERATGATTTLDKLVGFWLLWMFLISFLQPFEDGSGPVYAMGTIINVGGVYFLFRTWTADLKETRLLLGSLAIVLLPLALEMMFEQKTGRNLFGLLGGVGENSVMREGHIRANGSFRHPILAGTVGAVCFPLMVAFYRENKFKSIVGMVSCVLIVLGSRSSGPMMSLFVAVGLLFMWRFRRHYALFFKLSVAAYILADLVMSKPAYHLMARIDLSGGSTGAHRVHLIDSFFRYFNEWWLAGTNYTRHWMQFGVSYTDKHTDITSYYIAAGITGGLGGLIILLAIVFCAVRVGPLFSRKHQFADTRDTFLVWCFAAGMLAHAATSLSVSYFDQSVCFFWMNVALLGTAQAAMQKELTPS